MFSDSDLFWKLVVPPVLFGFCLAGVLFFGVPWLWEVFKPFLHAVTG